MLTSSENPNPSSFKFRAFDSVGRSEHSDAPPPSGWAVVIVYGSRYGNTRRVAEALASGMKQVPGVGVRSISVEDARADDLRRADLIAIGAPTEWGSASGPMKRFLAALDFPDLRGKQVFAFDTRYRSPISGSAAKFIERRLKELGGHVVQPRVSAFVRQSGTKSAGDIRDLLSEGAEPDFQRIGADLASRLRSQVRPSR